jgi:hypothetical protein
MFDVVRAYLYASCLWGLFALPAFGLGSVAPLLTAMVDAAPLLLFGWLLLSPKVWRRVHVSLVTIVVLGLVGALLWIDALVVLTTGGSLVEAARNLAVNARAPVLFAALQLAGAECSADRASRDAFYRRIVRDLWVITSIHFAVSAIQWIAPSAGQWLVPALASIQSGLSGLERHEVTGIFPNTIDFAYLVFAAYVVLSCERMLMQHRAPPLWMTGLFGVFILASGSVAAVACHVMYAGVLLAVTLGAQTRRRLVMGAVAIGLVAAVSLRDVGRTALLAKIDNMMLSRLGLIFVSTPLLVATDPSILATGTGADLRVLERALKAAPQVPLMFTGDEVAHTINDVYWVGLTLSLGLPLTLGFLLCTYRAFRGLSTVPVLGGRHDHVRLLGILVFLAGWLNQILLVRSFYSVLGVGLFAVELAFAERGKGTNSEPGEWLVRG